MTTTHLNQSTLQMAQVDYSKFSYPVPQKRPAGTRPDRGQLRLTDHYGPDLVQLSGIDGPCLVYSAFPHEVVKQLIVAGATL